MFPINWNSKQCQNYWTISLVIHPRHDESQTRQEYSRLHPSHYHREAFQQDFYHKFHVLYNGFQILEQVALACDVEIFAKNLLSDFYLEPPLTVVRMPPPHPHPTTNTTHTQTSEERTWENLQNEKWTALQSSADGRTSARWVTSPFDTSTDPMGDEETNTKESRLLYQHVLENIRILLQLLS